MYVNILSFIDLSGLDTNLQYWSSQPWLTRKVHKLLSLLCLFSAIWLVNCFQSCALIVDKCQQSKSISGTQSWVSVGRQELQDGGFIVFIGLCPQWYLDRFYQQRCIYLDCGNTDTRPRKQKRLDKKDSHPHWNNFK